jgi:hypothetical protein
MEPDCRASKSSSPFFAMTISRCGSEVALQLPFQSDFATEEACQQYLAACRWPDGFVCPDADISEPTNWCLNDGGSVLAAVIKSR